MHHNSSPTRIANLASALVATLTLVGSSPARALDVTGQWYASFEALPIPCSAEVLAVSDGVDLVAQCFGSLIVYQGHGRVDSASGAFAATGSITSVLGNCADVTYQGTFSSDSQSFRISVLDGCGLGFPTFSRLIGSRCGNGVVDYGDTCDDGNQNDGDCCSGACKLDPAGAMCGSVDPQCGTAACNDAGTCVLATTTDPCDDGNPCTTADRCVEEGYCIGGGDAPDGTPCDDNNACTGNDVCDFGFCQGQPQENNCPACTVCRPFDGTCEPDIHFASCTSFVNAGSSLDIRDSADNARDRVKWTFRLGVETATAEFGDPLTDTSYEVCAFDFGGENGPRLLFAGKADAASTCGQHPCWSPSRRGYRYQHGADGLRSITLNAGNANQSSIRVTGRGAGLGVAALPAVPPILVQLRNSNGACWGGFHSTAQSNASDHLHSASDQ